jgi:pimeloyl-ACP methyl ester carboxylesterase
VLLLWGANDRVMPRSYADVFARGISGKTETKIIPGAGHLAELDRPVEVAKAILDFTA